MALCSAVFPYAFLCSLPFFFLWSLLNGYLQWCLPLCIFTQPTLLLSVKPTQWLSAVIPSLMHFYAAYSSSSLQPTQWLSAMMPSLMHYYAAYPSSFCAAYSIAFCMPSLMHFYVASSPLSPTLNCFMSKLPFDFVCSLPFFFLCSLPLFLYVAYTISVLFLCSLLSFFLCSRPYHLASSKAPCSIETGIAIFVSLEAQGREGI